MSKKRIGILFGMEDTFPWALIDVINDRAGAAGEAIEASPVSIGAVRQDVPPAYDVILDRISHEVPFYRTFPEGRRRGGNGRHQQPALGGRGRQVLRQRRRPRRECRRAEDGPPAAQAAPAQHDGEELPEPDLGRLGRRLLVPRLPDLPETGLRRRLEGRHQVRRPGGVLFGLRPDARPRDDGAGGDRLHGLLPLLRRRPVAREDHAVRPGPAACPPLRGGRGTERALADGASG